MNLNVVLPLASSGLSFVFFVLLLDQWRERRRPYQLVWAIGMLWYAISAGTEFLGGAVGWNAALYRVWYLVGAIWVAGWLGLGTVMLLARTRFGLAFAASLGLASLFTWLSWLKYAYPGSGFAPTVYPIAGLIVAITVAALAVRRDERWAWLAAAAVGGGSVISLVMVATVPLPAPGFVLDPVTRIPTGDLYPGSIRLLTPFFNVTGAFALVFGALYSAYVFMPKRRVIRYDLGARPIAPNVARAIVGVPVNFVASIPGSVAALVTGRLNSRVPATLLIAVGGFIPAITSGANRFGTTSPFFVGELLGVLFLFAGFLVSVEVFREIRIPFTGIVLRTRRAEG